LTCRGSARSGGLSVQIFQPFVFNELNPEEIVRCVLFRAVFVTNAIESGAFATETDAF